MVGTYSLSNILLFSVLVVIALVVDLMAHRQDKAISVRSAAIWSVFWILLSLAFAGYIAKTHGMGDASLYLTGYLLEKSLSVDNLFVMMAIFANFRVPDKYQHRVLYYGILGALVFRLLFVIAGASLLALFGKWALLAFGLFVLWSAFKMWQSLNAEHESAVDYTNHWAVRGAARIIPVHGQLEGHSFFTKTNVGWAATPLFLCLLVIELADIMFAFDSVPAVFAITQEPFLVYTSNIFAILGLRSLYFLLAAARNALCHLDKAVIGILAFIGIKMLIDVAGIFHMPPLANLAVVGTILTAGIVGSFLFPEKKCRVDGPEAGGTVAEGTEETKAESDTTPEA